MQAKIIQYVISIVLGFLTSEQLKIFADALLDLIENTVQKSESKIDDAIVIPLCSLIRATFSIPDNDPPEV